MKILSIFRRQPGGYSAVDLPDLPAAGVAALTPEKRISFSFDLSVGPSGTREAEKALRKGD
jgi:hypothetical protein